MAAGPGLAPFLPSFQLDRYEFASPPGRHMNWRMVRQQIRSAHGAIQRVDQGVMRERLQLRTKKGTKTKKGTDLF